MKKILFALISVVCLLTSCDERPSASINKSAVGERGFSVREATVRGETHEYLYYESGYQGGLTHLPNCKYCVQH